MATVITKAGEALMARKAQANEQLDIDTFIFANVPGQDPAAPIDRDEGVPPVAQQVHQQQVQQYGRISDNIVVYSTVLSSTTGPFEFNWLGLYSSVNQTLVAIQHVPTVAKTVTAPGVAGNTLNRNFGIEYSGIAELTGINVAPETWQLDFTARLSGMDELTRQLAADMNGRDWFIGDGFKVEPRSTLNSFRVLPGVGYVSGLRIELENEHIFNVQSYPQNVYVDAWFDGTAESVWRPNVEFTVSNTEMDDYIDVNGVKHYVFKLAVLRAAADVEDLRSIEGLAEKIKNHETNHTAHKLSQITRAVRSNMSINPVDSEQSADWHGIFVEEFRKPTDEWDSDCINRALDYIRNLPFTGTKLIFERGRSYRFAHTGSLKNINDCHIMLNGAKLRRLNGEDTAATLTVAVNDAQNTTTYTVDAVPSNWRVGDTLTAFTDDTDANTSRDPRKITAINGDQVTIAAGFYFSETNTLPAGARIAKSYNAFASESALDKVNRRVFITDGTFDGNSYNQLNVSWRFIPELYLQGFGCLITRCEFFNMTTETIVGHGIDVVDNTFEDIGGSCYHLSVHDDAKELSGFSFFQDNTCKRTNKATNAKVGHSEGLVTFSWAAGNLIVKGNICSDGTEPFLGAFGSPTGPMGDRLMIVSGNIATRFPAIMSNAAQDIDGVLVTANVFDDCGDNTSPANLGPYWLNRSPTCLFDGNVLAGNTKAEQWKKTDKLLIGNQINSGAIWLGPNTVSHIKQGVSGYSVALPAYVMQVLESNSDAVQAIVIPKGSTAGYAVHAYEGPAAGSYLNLYDDDAKKAKIGTNISGGKTSLCAGSYLERITATEDGVELPSMNDNGSQYFYFGVKNSTGSWRVKMENGNLVYQKYNGSEYVTKNTILGA